MARVKRVAVAATAFLLVVTTSWACPIEYSPTVEAILNGCGMLAILVVTGGSLFGAGAVSGFLCRKTKLRLFRAEGLHFTLLRLVCFIGIAGAIGVGLALLLDVMERPLLEHVMWIYARLSGDDSYFSWW